MQDKSSYLLAADSEAEMEEWVTVLNKILQLNFEAAMQEKRNGDSHEGRRVSKAVTKRLSAKAFCHTRFCCPEARRGRYL